MEGALEGAALCRGHGRQSVTAQISVPITVFGIGKMLFAVVESLVEPVEVFLLARVAVEHERGDKYLVMRPPELHIMLICLGRLAAGVDEVKQSAVLLIPAGIDGVIEDGLSLFDELRLTCQLCILEKEPYAFDIMARIYRPALGIIKSRRSVSIHIFEDTAKLRFYVVFENIVNALLCPCHIFIPVLGITALHDETNI